MLGPFPLAGLVHWGVALSSLHVGVGATSVGKADVYIYIRVYSCISVVCEKAFKFH